jgi:hypothetical protein
MAVRLSASRAGRNLHPRKILDIHFRQRLSRTQRHSADGRIGSIEKNLLTSSEIELATFVLVA